MLELNNLTAGYGAVQVLNNVSLKVPERSVVTLLGANGAGKSTTLNTIAGLIKAWSGTIDYRGAPCAGIAANVLVRRGVALVAEQRELFLNMSVIENLMLGAFTRDDKAEVQQSLEQVFEMFPRLAERRGQNSRTLSGGEQQMLAIGRGLMSRPSLLLLDEPSLGIAPLLVQEIFAQVRKINAQGVAVLVVEQNAAVAMDVATYGYVMENGRIAIEGPTETLKKDPRIQEAYLGEAGH
jgi:branched-chain amino acid transport system ATP-binding protein